MQKDLFEPAHVALFREAAELRSEASLITDKARLIEQKAKAICPHEVLDTTRKYYEGGYLNREYEEYKSVCRLCKTVVKEWVEQGTNYG